MIRHEPLVELRGVGRTYGRGQNLVYALQDIDLTVHAGELLAVMGPSGSGKTTLAHIAGGLLAPTIGEVLVRGRTLTKSDGAMSAYRNKTIGFVFQNYGLMSHLTAIENVMMPLTVAGVSRRARETRAMRYLVQVGLEEQAKQRVDRLSGGQCQRVGIARALVTEPALILADEPTGNLDTAAGEKIMTMLEELTRAGEIAVVMVTHNDLLAHRADRLVRIENGRLTEATHARN